MLKKLLCLLLSFYFGLSVVSAQDTYYVTSSQLQSLTELISNLTISNENVMNLLELQTKDYENIKKNYETKLKIASEQQQNYQQLLNKLESRNSLYKYGLIIVGVLAFSLGVVVAK